MSRIGMAIAEGLIAFVATNLDDIVVLLLFFSQISANFRRRHIVFGQYLGFAAIVFASLPGFFGGLIVPREWIGLLGLLPIIIGVKQLVDRDTEAAQVQTVTGEFENSSCRNPTFSFFSSLLNPQTYKVAAVTVANGGDNISIYIP
ncbi:MAG: cadmium resistance transporter, partial [Xenococcaceae cyanobacterium]